MTSPSSEPNRPEASSSIAILAPDLGSSEPAIVTGWLAEPGESVDAGDRLVELLVPGVTFDVSAPVSGTLERIVRAADSRASAGDVLGWIVPAGSFSTNDVSNP